MTDTSPPGTYLNGKTVTPDPAGTYSTANATAPTTDPAGTYSSQYALNQVYVSWQQQASTVPMVFTNALAVANEFGTDSQEAGAARTFFGPSGEYDGVGQFIIVRFGLGQRSHLIGANLSADTLAQLQAINGTVGITLNGWSYSGAFDGSSITSGGLTGNAATFAEVKQAGHLLQSALNANRQTAAITTNDTIVPRTATFWGWTHGAQVYIDKTKPITGQLAVGATISGPGLGAKDFHNLIIADRGPVKNDPNAEQLSLFAADGNVGSEAHPVLITESYGLLTVGAVQSGSLSMGEQMTAAGGVLAPDTYLEYLMSAGNTGAGSQWIVNNPNPETLAQSREEAPAITVSEDGNGNPVIGPSGPNDYLSVTTNPAATFDQNPSTLSYLTGTAADALGLSQATALSLASPGGVHESVAKWLNGIVSQLKALGTGFANVVSQETRLLNSFGLWTAERPVRLETGPTLAGSSTPVMDPAGTWSGPGASAPTIDKPGTYSGPGASAPTLAQASELIGGQWQGGFYVPTAGASFETPDDPGYYTPRPGMSHELQIPGAADSWVSWGGHGGTSLGRGGS